MCLHDKYWITTDTPLGEDGCKTYSCHCYECGAIVTFRVDPKLKDESAEYNWTSFKKQDASNHVYRKGEEDAEDE